MAALLAAAVGLGDWRCTLNRRPVPDIGREVAIARHLEDDEEFRTPLLELIEHGKRLFMANWTDQEGGGRPLTKGTERS